MTKEDLYELNELNKEITELEELISSNREDKKCEAIIFEFEDERQVVATSPFIIEKVRELIRKLSQEELNTLKNNFENY